MNDSRLIHPSLDQTVRQLIGLIDVDKLEGHNLGAYRFYMTSMAVYDLDKAIRMADLYPKHMDIHKKRLRNRLDAIAEYNGAGYLNCTDQDLSALVDRAEQIINGDFKTPR